MDHTDCATVEFQFRFRRFDAKPPLKDLFQLTMSFYDAKWKVDELQKISTRWNGFRRWMYKNVAIGWFRLEVCSRDV